MNAKKLGVAMALVAGLGMSGAAHANNIPVWQEVGDAGDLNNAQNVGDEAGEIKGNVGGADSVDVFRFRWLVNSLQMKITSGGAPVLVLYDALKSTLLSAANGQLDYSNAGLGNTYFLQVQQSQNGGAANYTVTFEPVLADGTAIGAVPEPASLALLGLGLAGLSFSRRRAY